MSVDLKCPVPVCREKFFDYKVFVRHLKQHVRDRFSVNCPIINCSKSYSVISSLTSHLSRCHRHLLSGDASMQMNSFDETDFEAESREIVDQSNETSNGDISGNSSSMPNAELPLNKHAMFLMCLKYKHLIPDSVVDNISQKIASLFHYHEKLLTNTILPILQINRVLKNVSAEICESITSCLSCSFYFDGELRSSYCRKLFFENSVKLVSPV